MTILINSIPVSRIFDIPIRAMTMEQSLDLIHQSIMNRRHLQIGVINAAKVVNMQHDQMLREDVLSSDIILADGMSIVWASRLLGCPLPERVAGIDLMIGILKRGNTHGYRVYCLGATDDVSDKVTLKINSDFPGVKLVGRRNGYFKEEEDELVAKEIAASKADLLFIAITSPKKEKFLAKWSSKIDVPVCHGVGGSFDVLAGKVDRAPESWQRLGLEWFYRFKQEPGRLWKRYLVTNSLFIWLVIKEFLRKSSGNTS